MSTNAATDRQKQQNTVRTCARNAHSLLWFVLRLRAKIALAVKNGQNTSGNSVPGVRIGRFGRACYVLVLQRKISDYLLIDLLVQALSAFLRVVGTALRQIHGCSTTRVTNCDVM